MLLRGNNFLGGGKDMSFYFFYKVKKKSKILLLRMAFMTLYFLALLYVYTNHLNTHLYKYRNKNCTSEILCFLQITGLWQPCVEQVSWCHFSNSICSFLSHLSLSHFGNSYNISNFFISIIFVMVICDQWSLMKLLQKDYDSPKAQMVSIF